jgi:SPP1 gp7 family putative phage head morphogenesis protein
VEAEIATAHAATLQIGFPHMGPDEVARLSATYASQRAGELMNLEGSVSVTRVTQQRVRVLVAHNLETGESLQKLRRSIVNDLAFSPARAETIARTETATALGHGQRTVAVAQGRDQKKWVTQGDARVEPECLMNEGDGWIGMEQPFSSGDDWTPAHQNCRCTVISRTQTLHQGVTVLVDKVVCPTCEKRLPINNVPKGTEAYCKRCNATFEV